MKSTTLDPLNIASSLNWGETEVHEAIREALVNALIHADYQGIGGIVIEKEINGFNFSNPGTLLVSLDQLLFGNVSECRNKALQTMFMMFGAAEKAGSGVDKIRKGWASQHWRFPVVTEQVHPDRVCWQLPMVSLISDESISRLQHCFGDKFKHFSRLEIQVLAVADTEEVVDNARMRQITGNHTADMTRVLQELVAKGALTQKGKARGSRYSLASKPDISAAFDSIHKASDSVHNKYELEELTILKKIAEPAKDNQRLPPKQLEQLIRELCHDRWLTRKQLAELLHRNSDGLRARFLTPMVEHGRLHLRYPDKPNRADQAYTSS